MEIQKEETIEIVGTQYEDIAVNHQPQFLKNLTLKHQKDNPHDSNAVILMTYNGKELGFLPRGYASLYAPAIDSGRYIFTIEIVKSEQDSERPILIVKIISELKNHNEEDIEKNIIAFVQNIVNLYAQLRTEYLNFITIDTVNINKLASVLNNIRLIKKLISNCDDIIKSNNIEKTSENPVYFNKDTLVKKINELQADVNDILKEIQKIYNELLDIDDEEEYNRTQSKIRAERKKFRNYNNILTCLLDTVTNHVDLTIQFPENNNTQSEENTSEIKTDKTIPTVMEVPDNLQSTKHLYHYLSELRQNIIKTVDFNNPHDCTHCKPCSFVFNGIKHSVKSWKELYNKFLVLLYNDNKYSVILKSLNGKSLFTKSSIDFSTEASKFHTPISISKNFFTEGNLPTTRIINRIKYLKKLCSIDDEHMIIEYSALDKDIISDDTDILTDFQQSDYIDLSDSKPVPEQTAVDENDTPTTTDFSPDITKPFVLKDAIIEILQSDSPEIAKYREHRNGISLQNFREIIKKYYGKIPGPFEISKIIMLDRKLFKCVGKGCYTLNEISISHKEKAPEQSVLPENNKPSEITTESVDEKITIEAILDVIRENSDNLQYKGGFGTYEIKFLLRDKGFSDVSEEQIDVLMSECEELREIENGYYTLAEVEDTTETSVEVSDSVDNNTEDTVDDVAESPISANDPDEPQRSDTNARHIVLRLNGNIIRAYDCSDALSKICEFAINYRPFEMACITGQAIQIHENSAFYRKAVPVDGYNKLSNGLQVITVTTLSDLQIITAQVKKYCHIDDNMISIISR